MRDNGPVTNREIKIQDEDILVSKTDTGGRIQFCNQAFVDISGFNDEELVGSPHNLVRHPDMPKEAFANLWQTIKSGVPWQGLVKNRAKNGDHYWVRANVTPTIEDGEVTGYISIRTKPTEAEKKNAERVYADLRKGDAKDVGLEYGEIIGTSTASRVRNFFASIKGALTLAFGTMFALMLLIGGYALNNEYETEQALERVYENRVKPLNLLKQVSDDYAVFVVDASHKVRNGNFNWQEGIESIDLAEKRIKENLDIYFARNIDPDEAQIVTKVKNLIPAADELIARLREIFVQKDTGALDALVKDELYQTIDPLTEQIGNLSVVQNAIVGQQVEDARQAFTMSVIVTVILLLIAALLTFVYAAALIRKFRRPLEEMGNHFEAMARNDSAYLIPLPKVPDFKPVIQQLRALHAKVAYNRLEREENACRNRRAGTAKGRSVDH